MAMNLKFHCRGAEPLVISAAEAEIVCDRVDEERFADEVRYRLTARVGDTYCYDDDLTAEVRFLLDEGYGCPDDIVEGAMAAWYDSDWEDSRESALRSAFETFRCSMAQKRSERVRREMAELGRF